MYTPSYEPLFFPQVEVHPGDIWKVGRHLVACLDSRQQETIDFIWEGQQQSQPAMIFADPPYGISVVKRDGTIGGQRQPGRSSGLQGKTRSHSYSPVIGDESPQTAITTYKVCTASFPNATHIWWGANYYAHQLPPSRCWIIWDKENTGDFADAELAWCSKDSSIRIFRHQWNGLFKASEQGQERIHPNQKPVELARWCFDQYGKAGDIIYDPFLGSGITLVAAEKMGRTVYGSELSPAYCSLAIQRWQHLTGESVSCIHRKDSL